MPMALETWSNEEVHCVNWFLQAKYVSPLKFITNLSRCMVMV